MWKTQKGRGSEAISRMWKTQTQSETLTWMVCTIGAQFLATALIDLTYLAVLFNFTSLYRSFFRPYLE
jgi:hypothetical protein